MIQSESAHTRRRPAWLSILVSTVFLLQILLFWVMYWRNDMGSGFGPGYLLICGLYYPYPIWKWYFLAYTLLALMFVIVLFFLIEKLVRYFGCPVARFHLSTLLVAIFTLGLAASPIAIWWEGDFPYYDSNFISIQGLVEARPWLLFGYINLILILTGMIVFLMESILRRRSKNECSIKTAP